MRCILKETTIDLSLSDLVYDHFYQCISDDHKGEIFTVFKFNTSTKDLLLINLSHNFITPYNATTGCGGVYSPGYMKFKEVSVELHYTTKE